MKIKTYEGFSDWIKKLNRDDPTIVEKIKEFLTGTSAFDIRQVLYNITDALPVKPQFNQDALYYIVLNPFNQVSHHDYELKLEDDGFKDISSEIGRSINATHFEGASFIISINTIATEENFDDVVVKDCCEQIKDMCGFQSYKIDIDFDRKKSVDVLGMMVDIGEDVSGLKLIFNF